MSERFRSHLHRNVPRMSFVLYPIILGKFSCAWFVPYQGDNVRTLSVVFILDVN